MTSFVAELDPDLIARARQGDRAAHATLYEKFGTSIYTLACRMTQRPAVADEILQETFVEVIRKIDSFRGEAPLGAWIRRIAVNKCLMHLRSAWHRHVWQSDSLLETDAVIDRAVDSDEGSSRIQHYVDLTRALANIPDTARIVVWLHDVEGYTHREIGEMMGKTASFSKSQLARAHTRLRAMLDSDGTEPCMQVSNSC